MQPSGVGMMAALGSFLGLVAGGAAGNALAKGSGTRDEKLGTMVIATVLGTAVGAFAGAIIASPTSNTTCTTVTSS